MSDLRYIERPAATLDDFEAAFDPTLAVDPDSRFYVERTDVRLARLARRLVQGADRPQHLFLCGHRGSGKTTELMRLERRADVQERYVTVFLTVQRFGPETVDLTHDALLLEIGLALAEKAEELGIATDFRSELRRWGLEVVKTFLHDEAAEAEAGAGANAWLAFFKAQLRTRREWSTQERQILEPRIQDLLGILNRIAAALREQSGKQVLVFVDDLEKGESDADRSMQRRLFQESYESLVQPRLSIVYVTPIYFRSEPGSRIPPEQLVAFSALCLYDHGGKAQDVPRLDDQLDGYRIARAFVERRIEGADHLFAEGVLDELLRIGGGLFRDTARAVRDAADFAVARGADRIEAEDAENVFHHVKKEYQPMIRGEAVDVLQSILATPVGWVPGVEPYLQSRAVVEYENHDLWLDLRYPLKRYVRELPAGG